MQINFRRVFWLLIALCLGMSFTRVWADTLPTSITKALKQARVPLSAVSFEVRKIDNKTDSNVAPLLSHRANVPMNPASVMKLVTTFSALDMLGPDFTWQTSFYTNGKLGNGVLQGDLIIHGGGDPKWVLERIEENFKTLQVLGVRHITGDIILDNSVFELTKKHEADFDGEHLSPYNSTPDGLLVNFKAIILTFTPDELTQTVRVKSEPPIAGVSIDSTVPMGNNSCGDWRSGLRADFTHPDRISFAGSYSARCGEKVWPIAYSDPATFAARVVKAMYNAAGGRLDGQVRTGTLPTSAVLLYHAPSLPLSQIIADVNKFSNNVMAQQVFLSLSAQESKDNLLGKISQKLKGSFNKSRDVVKHWWQRHFGKNKSQTTEPELENGSGLSRSERITAHSLSELLHTAAKHPHADVFAKSLSIAGVDGTAANMAKRGVANASIGQAQLKTGTLRDVVSIAGYATAQSGQRYSVVGIINHPNAPSARAALDALVEWTVVDH